MGDPLDSGPSSSGTANTGGSDSAAPPPDAPDASTCLHDFSARDITGQMQDLAQWEGKVALVVNTASRCGFRGQFQELEQLQQTYGERGFTVLGFPSDQFRQELDSDEEIDRHCRADLGITFPMFSTVDVNGPDAHPLFQWLTVQKGGILGGRIAWNFTKFLIGPDGQVIRRYAPPIPPRRIARRIEQELPLR